MTHEQLTDLLGQIGKISDPIQRAKRFTALIDDLGTATSSASEGRRNALVEAKNVKGMTQAEIAKALKLTPARVNQMLKATPGPPPERALLAPESGRPVTFAVVQKSDSEVGQPVLALTTRKALSNLQDLAGTLSLETAEEFVKPPGLLDLNQPNLAVLVGPRISALIAQIVTSDPVIHWKRDKLGHFYLVDSKTGTEFHSDFDNGWSPSREGERQCIAHIGRIRRPDGQGSFLYLGGAHAAGTAGAVEVFIREYAAIWEQAKRSLWSAIVVTKADENGVPTSAELVTPIYVHGKR